MYNSKYKCKYNSHDIFLDTDIVSEKDKDFIRNVLYKQDLLNIFCIEEHCEEKMNTVLMEIYEKIKNIPVLKDCINNLSSNFSISLQKEEEREEQEIGFIILFSYHYLYLTHTCISEFIEYGKISELSLSNLKKLVFL